MDKEKAKVQLYLEPELLEAVDQYWHGEMLKSRPVGIRILIRKGLEAEKVRRKDKHSD